MREIDFLGGRPAANLARFALPALGANLLQSADQVVDMLVVGAFVGERGLAALANATMVGFVANSLSLGLFADDPEAVAAGVLYLRACCSANSLAYAAMYALDSFAQATGAPRLAAVNALLDAVVVRVGLAVLLVPALGYPGVLAAQALSPVLPCAVGAAYLRRYARRVRSETGIGAKAAS